MNITEKSFKLVLMKLIEAAGDLRRVLAFFHERLQYYSVLRERNCVTINDLVKKGH